MNKGDEVTITRHGRPVAVVVRPDSLRIRRADAALAASSAVRDLLDRARSQPLSDEGSLSEERADELVIEVDANRSRP